MIPLPPGARLDHQPFDSGFLGGPVYRLALAEAADLSALPGWAGTEGVRLVMARVPASAVDVQRCLEAAGFRAIERLVTLERPLADTPPMPDGVRLARPEDVVPCVAMARTAFRYDRFHADRRIDPAAAGALKAKWVENGLTGRADAPLVAVEDGRAAGFNLCLRNGDAGVIDLIATDPQVRRRGVGRRLVQAALAHYAAAGAARMRVGTQADNAPSLAMYRAAGFEPVSEAVTYHLIPERT